jgi:hypothetical protein
MIKLATVGLILLAFIVGGGIVQKTRQDNKSGEALKEGTLKWHAKKAKDKGATAVSIPPPMVEYIGVGDSPDFVLSNYSLVIAQPTASKTYAVEYGIVTWFKFRIVETISQRPPLPNLPTVPPPQDLLPLNDGEFLVPKYGGTVSVDDVNVTMTNQGFPPFSTDTHYLLFISKDPSGFATLWAGPDGVFTVTRGGRVESISKKPHPVKDALENRFDNSLGQLKQKLVNN